MEGFSGRHTPRSLRGRALVAALGIAMMQVLVQQAGVGPSVWSARMSTQVCSCTTQRMSMDSSLVIQKFASAILH